MAIVLSCFIHGLAAQDASEIGYALDCPQLTWELDADTNRPAWFSQWEVTSDGMSAAQSGFFMSTGQVSTLTTRVQGPCSIRFKMKMASPDSAPVLFFAINGTNRITWRGNVDWTYQAFFLDAGEYVLRWSMYCSNSVDPARVSAWLDEVSYATGGDVPSVVPVYPRMIVNAGTGATLSMRVEGHQPIYYQWQHEGKDVPGATNLQLMLRNFQVWSAGTYSLVASNLYGTATGSMRVSINERLPIIGRPVTNFFTVPGGEVCISAQAYGSEPMSYQWRFENTILAGETNAELKLRNVGTNQVGRYYVSVTNRLGMAQSPAYRVILSRVKSVIHISADGLSGKFLADGLAAAPERFPNFSWLLTKSAATLNARCDYFISYTVPNHLSMLTGRPTLQPEGQPDTVPHGYFHNMSFNDPNLHTSGNTNVPYKASVFDVAHDEGLTTAFFAGKSSLRICAASYNATNGALDLTGEDNGRNKIDTVGFNSSSDVVKRVTDMILSNSLPNYTFMHWADMDLSGHFKGWGTSEWYADLERVDSYLKQIMAALESRDSLVERETVLILTADHGGGVPSTSHTIEYEPLNYTIPIFACGPGFPAGKNLYEMFLNRADPGVNRVDYNAPEQPLRNGDTGNIALQCLGLPFIPGSTMTPMKAVNESPCISLKMGAQGTEMEWSRAAAGFVLEWSTSFSTSAVWNPVSTDIRATPNIFRHTMAPDGQAWFFRLKKAP